MSAALTSVTTAQLILHLLEVESANKTGYQVFKDKNGKMFATDDVRGQRMRVPLKAIDKVKEVLPIIDAILGGTYETITDTSAIVNFDAPDYAERYRRVMSSGNEGIGFVQKQIGKNLASMLPDKLSDGDKAFVKDMQQVSKEFPDLLPAKATMSAPNILMAMISLPRQLETAKSNVVAFIDRVKEVVTSRPVVVSALLTVAAISTGVAVWSGVAIMAELAVTDFFVQAEAGMLVSYLAKKNVPKSIITLISSLRAYQQELAVYSEFIGKGMKTAFLGLLGIGSFIAALEQLGEAGMVKVEAWKKTRKEAQETKKTLENTSQELVETAEPDAAETGTEDPLHLLPDGSYPPEIFRRKEEMERNWLTRDVYFSQNWDGEVIARPSALPAPEDWYAFSKTRKGGYAGKMSLYKDRFGNVITLPARTFSPAGWSLVGDAPDPLSNKDSADRVAPATAPPLTTTGEDGKIPIYDTNGYTALSIPSGSPIPAGYKLMTTKSGKTIAIADDINWALKQLILNID